MTSLDHDSKSLEECAALVADTVPLVVRTIRAEMRRHRGLDLSVPQFRTLTFLRRNPGASLSAVAEHIGLTPPSTSKMIDRLEKQGLLIRYNATEDRRRIALKLTDQGASNLKVASDATRSRLAEQLSALSPEARAEIMRAMKSLRTVFGTEAAQMTRHRDRKRYAHIRDEGINPPIWRTDCGRFTQYFSRRVRDALAFMGIGQLLTMPLFFASNAIYPVAVMPGWLQVIARLNPLSYQVDLLRGLMLGQSTASGVALDFSVLLVATIVFIWIGSKLYPRAAT